MAQCLGSGIYDKAKFEGNSLGLGPQFTISYIRANPWWIFWDVLDHCRVCTDSLKFFLRSFLIDGRVHGGPYDGKLARSSCG